MEEGWYPIAKIIGQTREMNLIIQKCISCFLEN